MDMHALAARFHQLEQDAKRRGIHGFFLDVSESVCYLTVGKLFHVLVDKGYSDDKALEIADAVAQGFPGYQGLRVIKTDKPTEKGTDHVDPT
jgi:hypothetical protein